MLIGLQIQERLDAYKLGMSLGISDGTMENSELKKEPGNLDDMKLEMMLGMSDEVQDKGRYNCMMHRSDRKEPAQLPKPISVCVTLR